MSENAAGEEDLLGTLLSLPHQLEETRARPAEVEFPAGIDRVVYAGMGGSAIAGEYVAAWAWEEGDLPVDVVRGYEPPAWLDGDALVAAVSYSGNTEETLSVFRGAAGQAGARAAVTSGGHLAELAGDDVPVLGLPPGHEPRAALGHLFGRAVEVAEAAGVLEAGPGLEEAGKVLGDLRPALAPDRDAAGNEVRELARDLEGRLPVVYGAGPLTAAARRAAGQLNENAKHLALHGTVPEMNHNDVVGWRGLDEADPLAAVLLRDPEEHPQVAERFGFLEDLLEEKGVPVSTVEARGSSPPARLLSATLVVDAASVYLARRKGVDPAPVAAIEDLKARLAETGFLDDLVG